MQYELNIRYVEAAGLIASLLSRCVAKNLLRRSHSHTDTSINILRKVKC